MENNSSICPKQLLPSTKRKTQQSSDTISELDDFKAEISSNYFIDIYWKDIVVNNSQNQTV